MPFDGPFRLGPFVVDPLGRLQPNALEASPTVHVHWRGLWVSSKLETAPPAEAGDGGQEVGGQAGRLLMSAVMGRVPSTAGSPGDSRSRALGLFHTLTAIMPPRWQMRLLPDHRVCITADRDVALPATASSLVTLITCFLLDLAPYLDLLSEPEAGFEAATEPSPVNVGTANT